MLMTSIIISPNNYHLNHEKMKNYILNSIYLILSLVAIPNYINAQPDVVCQFNEYNIETLSRSICRVSFTRNGTTKNCTGTLVNNENNDRRAFVITARHWGAFQFYAACVSMLDTQSHRLLSLITLRFNMDCAPAGVQR